MPSSKKSPRVFWWVLVLIVLTEWFVYTNRDSLVHDYWNKFVINEKYLVEIPGDYDYLIVGNSIQKTGILPAAVSDRLLSIGLAGAKPLAHYMLLKRYLRTHKPPKIIFLYVDAENPYDSMSTIARYFLNLDELADYGRDLSRPEREAYFLQTFSTLDHRRVGLGGERIRYRETNAEFVRHMIENRGYMPSPLADRVLAPDYFAVNAAHPRLQAHITVTARDRKYLDKLMKLMESKGIRVVFLGMVVPGELHGIFERNGFFTEYRAYLEELKTAYPSATPPAPDARPLDNAYFGDFQHLNGKGAELYTRLFKETVFDPAVASAGDSQ